jgi:hypothetical protein
MKWNSRERRGNSLLQCCGYDGAATEIKSSCMEKSIKLGEGGYMLTGTVKSYFTMYPKKFTHASRLFCQHDVLWKR